MRTDVPSTESLRSYFNAPKNASFEQLARRLFEMVTSDVGEPGNTKAQKDDARKKLWQRWNDVFSEL